MIDVADLMRITDSEDHTLLLVHKEWLDPLEYDLLLIADYLGLDIDHISDVVVRHAYGFKAQTASSRECGWQYEFMEYPDPGRGRFKCTIFEVAA